MPSYSHISSLDAASASELTRAKSELLLTRKSPKKRKTIPLPSLTETCINWERVDRVSSCLCPCLPFITQLVVISTTGSFSFGLNTALLNTAASYIAADFRWCDYAGYTTCDKAIWYKSLVSTSVFLGAAGGALTAGRFMNNGPRLITMASLLAYLVGVCGSVLSNGFTSLLFARLIVGYGVGISSAATPQYISEMAPNESRGYYGSFHQVVLSAGQLIAVSLGLAFSILPQDLDETSVPSDEQRSYEMVVFDKVWWRVMLGLGLIPVLLAIAFMGPIYTFETPQYYIRKEDIATASELLRRVYNKEDVSQEIKKLQAQAAANITGRRKKSSFVEFLKRPGYARAFLIGIGVAVFQQITGVNAYITASNRLFADAGLSAKYVTYASLGLVSVALPCNLLCTSLVERLGRRTLLTWGAVGATLSVAPATIFYWMEWNRNQNSDALTYSAITGACLFMAFFSVSAGPVTWLYIFEIFPMDIKSKASSICVALNWIGGIAMVFCASLLESKVTFTIFFVSGLFYILFTFAYIEETRGRAMGDSPYVPAAGDVVIAI